MWATTVPTSGTAPPGIDVTVPSVARVYDYALGGKDNYEADRQAARRIAERLPEARQLAVDCRDLVRRVVRWLVAEAGIDQIIDIGSGLPTAENVHEVARRVRDGVRVVYVDNDPIVLAHGRALLEGDPGTEIVHGDVRVPETIFGSRAVDRLIDPSRPFAVLLSCVLHHLHERDEPAAVMERLKRHVTSGSYLLVANFVHAPGDPRAPWIEEAFIEGGLGSGRFRTLPEHEHYLDGLDLVEPGLVFANDWRPDDASPRDSPVHRLHLGGVGRRP